MVENRPTLQYGNQTTSVTSCSRLSVWYALVESSLDQL